MDEDAALQRIINGHRLTPEDRSEIRRRAFAASHALEAEVRLSMRAMPGDLTEEDYQIAVELIQTADRGRALAAALADNDAG